jgi:hypothetical protein
MELLFLKKLLMNLHMDLTEVEAKNAVLTNVGGT